jgi:hypothetical protein
MDTVSQLMVPYSATRNKPYSKKFFKYRKHICIMKKTQHFGQNLLTIKIHLHTTSVWHAQTLNCFLLIGKFYTQFVQQILQFWLFKIWLVQKNRITIFEMSLCNNIDQTRIILALNMSIIVYSRREYINICQTHS